MRAEGWLRNPIRGDHQSRLADLEVSETDLDGFPNWPPRSIYPQTLVLEFSVAPGVTEVQIAPLWEGELSFVPDDDAAGNPTLPGDAVEANYGSWSVEGDLLLTTRLPPRPSAGDHLDAFATLVPFVTPAPE